MLVELQKTPIKPLRFNKLIELSCIFSREDNLSSDTVTFKFYILTDHTLFLKSIYLTVKLQNNVVRLGNSKISRNELIMVLEIEN